MLERIPEFIHFEDVFFAEFGRRTEDGLVEMLEEFLEERVRRHTDADFGALDVEAAGDVRVGRQNESVRAGNARLHDVEGEIVDARKACGRADVGDNQSHEKLFHGFLEGVQLVNGFRGFGVAADGVAGFRRVEDKGVVFKRGGGQLDDSRLRVLRMYFETHISKNWKSFRQIYVF